MRQSLGETRSDFRSSHALISADSHEPVPLPAWEGAELIHMITPALGAEFSFFHAKAAKGLTTHAPGHRAQRFVLVRSGEVTLDCAGRTYRLSREGYAFLPAGLDHVISSDGPAELSVIEKPYVELADRSTAGLVVSAIPQVPQKPMKGDKRLLLQKLLPSEDSFDFEVNVMDFQPGASLPYVETHFMEHGLLMLDGGGIYRLGENWYPVAEGDAIWMGPFCPQWFGAIGHSRARYLIYKNWNRDPLS